MRLSRGFLWASVSLAAACAGNGQVDSGSRTAVRAPGTVTAEEIARSGATNAWEVIERNPQLASVRGSPDRPNQPVRISKRGRNSILLDSSPRVVLDGVRVTDFRVLSSIPARTIELITVLSGPDATFRFGPDMAGGCIVVETRKGPIAQTP